MHANVLLAYHCNLLTCTQAGEPRTAPPASSKDEGTGGADQIGEKGEAAARKKQQNAWFAECPPKKVPLASRSWGSPGGGVTCVTSCSRDVYHANWACFVTCAALGRHLTGSGPS